MRFDKIAEGFGCHGEYVEKEDDMGPAIERAHAADRSAASSTSASTRRRTPRKCRSTTNSEPGTPKALSREGFWGRLGLCANI